MLFATLQVGAFRCTAQHGERSPFLLLWYLWQQHTR